jgi:hypothetical protein
MADFSEEQKKVLEHTSCSAIYDFLKGYDKPASLSEIGEGAELRDLAVAFYHLSRLVEVELVEKVVLMPARGYRVVGEIDR